MRKAEFKKGLNRYRQGRTTEPGRLYRGRSDQSWKPQRRPTRHHQHPYQPNPVPPTPLTDQSEGPRQWRGGGFRKSPTVTADRGLRGLSSKKSNTARIGAHPGLEAAANASLTRWARVPRAYKFLGPLLWAQVDMRTPRTRARLTKVTYPCSLRNVVGRGAAPRKKPQRPIN
jgi:hypothetical protein